MRLPSDGFITKLQVACMRSPAYLGLANMPRSIERGGATFSPNYLQDDECHKSVSALTAVLTLCHAPPMWNQKLVQCLDSAPKDFAPIMTPALTGCQKIFLFLQILDGGRHVELSTFVLISQWKLDPHQSLVTQFLKPSDISDFLSLTSMSESTAPISSFLRAHVSMKI